MKHIAASSKKRALIFLAVAFVQFAVQTSALLKGTEYIVSALTFDDAYYYFQTAWNLKMLGVSTFDGINATNGVQLLWFGVIFLLAQIAQTKINLLVLSLGTCFFFNAASHLVIWKLSETVDRPVLGVYMSSVWFLLTFGSEFYSTGMENSLHAFIFWIAIWQTTAFLSETGPRKKNQRFILLTLILVLNVWARLDAAIFSVILYVYCLLHLDIRRNLKYVIVSVLLALAGLIIQLVVFYQLGGSWLPVSSLVKQSWSHWGNIVGLTATRLLVVLLLLPVLEIIIHRYAGQKTRLRGIWYSLLAGVMLHVIATGGVSAYDKFLWYLSPAFVFLALTLAMSADGLSRILSNIVPAARRMIPAAFALAFIALAVFLFQVRWTMSIPVYKLGYHSALWISENVPPDARLASWNAGILGYFSGRTVINLDGLINGTDYYRQVVSGPKSWMTYVKEQNVDYVIDYSRNYVTTPEFPIIRTFVLTGRPNEVVMWQVAGDKQEPYRQIEFAGQ
ncbi:MAG: hypothetical protein D6768_06475 [Chloroflexi bacterium]|nr:MAG: hypothetical protein D6768_06475 [Chloroflexota bacterium]